MTIQTLRMLDEGRCRRRCLAPIEHGDPHLAPHRRRQGLAPSILMGTLMLWVATLARGEFDLHAIARLDLSQGLSLLYLGVLGSALAYIWYYDGLRRIGATRSGVFIALNPLTAVLLGALLLGEQLSLLMGLGGVLILGGIYQCNKPLAGQAKKAIL